MTSHMPNKCCFVAVKHSGSPVGHVEVDSHGTSTYLAVPKEPKSDLAIILLTNVWGHLAPNNQLLADQYAANGYFTIMPDLFHGEAPPLDTDPKTFEWQKWLWGQQVKILPDTDTAGGKGEGHQLQRVGPIVKSSIKWLREEKGYSKIGGAGYCFGAKYVVRSMALGEGVDVGYLAHPSWVDEEELEKVTGPISIAAAESDDIFTMEMRHRTEIMLRSIQKPYQINLFSGVSHGFAAWGNIDRAEVKFAKEQAFSQAIQWFGQWLK